MAKTRRHPEHHRKNVNQIDKIIPGYIPPRDEPEYKDRKSVDFVAIFDRFSPESLNEYQLSELAKDEPHSSGYVSGETYTLDGEDYLIPPEPVTRRIKLGNSAIDYIRHDLIKRQQRWYDYAEGSQRASEIYKECRRELTTGLIDKVCLYLSVKEKQSMSDDDMERQETEYDQYTRGYLGHDKNYTPRGREAKKEEMERLNDLDKVFQECGEIDAYLEHNDAARECVLKLMDLSDRYDNDSDLWNSILQTVDEVDSVKTESDKLKES